MKSYAKRRQAGQVGSIPGKFSGKFHGTKQQKLARIDI